MSSERLAGLVLAVAAAGLVASGRGAAPRFFPDDPLWQDDDRAVDASGTRPTEESDPYDFIAHTFFKPGDRRDVAAMNVNTLDEVPDSSWFTNRIGRQPMTLEAIVRGPDTRPRLSVDSWPIVQGKDEGLQPGWRVADPQGAIYQIEFDPPGHPEMATGAEVIGTAFYHAFGYHVVEVYLVEIDPATIVIHPDATIRDLTGRRRRFTRADVDEVLRRAARRANGTYRALASRFAPGVPLGHFRYYGTRPDDPNDIVPHEHRRELRANRVFAAWLNHDDSRGLNSLDMLETSPDGKKWVKHYLFDFGSIMGSGTIFAEVPRGGHEYLLDWSEGFRTLATMGLYLRPWLRIRYPEVPPAVGRFEADAFDPPRWRPEYPNPAFDNMRPEDAFWAARIVARFTDEAIAAVVGKAAFSDPRATEYLTATLIRRRDKVLRAWLTQVMPLVDPRIDEAGVFSFDNAAVAAGVATPPSEYSFVWSRFDNATGAHEPIGPPTSRREPRTVAPLAAFGDADYLSVAVTADHPQHPIWQRQAARVYFRRTSGGWMVVGIERAHGERIHRPASAPARGPGAAPAGRTRRGAASPP
jgi:hypothetical protein